MLSVPFSERREPTVFFFHCLLVLSIILIATIFHTIHKSKGAKRWQWNISLPSHAGHLIPPCPSPTTSIHLLSQQIFTQHLPSQGTPGRCQNTAENKTKSLPFELTFVSCRGRQGKTERTVYLMVISAIQDKKCQMEEGVVLKGWFWKAFLVRYVSRYLSKVSEPATWLSWESVRARGNRKCKSVF